MKHNLIFILFLVSLLVSCESNVANEPTIDHPFLPSSMKGYELYSWKADGKWNYTLITGTNRNKEYDEITVSDNLESEDWIKISVSSLTSLKQLLSRVPANESISWIGDPARVSGFSIPETLVVAQIENHCADLDLNLQIIN
jgi:hypothetical protein